jgi:aminoglycoside phosphotransferase family enzyme/predicted kinase
MSNPAFYPTKPETVELVQTHISFVFMAGDIVYKVKKAVDFGFLDFTSLEKRKHYCFEEVRLNRRLAPSVYLDVVEISENDEGALVVGPGKNVVEYAVRMRRLPMERMLKKIIAADDFDPALLNAVAEKLVDFHQQAATGGIIDDAGSLETIRLNHEENFSQTEKYIGITIPDYQYRFIRDYDRRFLKENEALFQKRVHEHRIRDCHGDLHLEHIVMGDEIAIFDCIEFNERFRFGDVAAEVAFLAMDLDFNGYPAYADWFVNAYTECSGDEEIPVLLNFYRCYYAYVRGKVVSFRLDDPSIAPGDREAAKMMANRYFDLAYTYAARLERPTLILMTGLMGTGKSVIAKGIAPRLGAVTLQTDVLRKELLGIAPTERHYEAFGNGIYGEEMSRKTYDEALRQAVALLEAGRSVIIDASYKRRVERAKAFDAARGIGAAYYIVECTCPEEVVKERLDARISSSDEASDGRWEIYLAQKNDFDPVTEVDGGVHIVADTSMPPEQAVAAVLEATSLR